MESTSIDFRNMDELVFEKRNKLYGAYLLRTSYNKNVFMAFVAAHVLALLLILSFRFNRTETKSVVERIIPEVPVIHLENEFDVKPEQQQQKAIVRTVRRDDIIPTRVTPDEVTPPENSNPTEQYTAPIEGVEGGNVEPGQNTLLVGNGNSDQGTTVAPPNEPIIMGIQATYKGGMEAMAKFLRKKIRQPRTPMKGIVFVQFVVNSKGEVVDIQVIKGIHKDYDKEAVRVVSLMEDWEPGLQGGKPVSVRMVLPINFTLPE